MTNTKTLMLKPLPLLLLFSLPAAAQLATPANDVKPLAGPYSVSEIGPHHRVWQRVSFRTNELTGKIRALTNSYTELQTGLARPLNGAWVPASDQIQISRTGAEALNAQCQ